MLKKAGTLLLIMVYSITFTGCYDRKEVDDFAYVIAVGLDKAITNNIRITLQFAVPTAIGGGGGEGGGGGGGGESKSVSLMTLEAPSLMSGLNLANNFISKQINLAHTKVVVFSEDMAREGVSKFILAISRLREFRPNTTMLVARGSAEDFIKGIKPILTPNPAKFYEMITMSYSYTGFTAKTQFHNFYLKSKSTYEQPVATLAGVSNFSDPKDFNTEGSTFKQKNRSIPFEGDYMAGDIPKTAEQKSELMGLAVFNGGKMVGELDGEETTWYLMTTGEYNYANISLPDPLAKDETVILNVKKSRDPTRKVTIVDGKPHIYAKIALEADIQAIQSGIDYEEPSMTIKLEQAYEKFIKEGLERLYYRTSKEFNADICGFGKGMKKNFLTFDKWEEFHWLDKYKDATFEANVDLQIRRTGLIIRSMPIIEIKGESEK